MGCSIHVVALVVIVMVVVVKVPLVVVVVVVMAEIHLYVGVCQPTEYDQQIRLCEGLRQFPMNHNIHVIAAMLFGLGPRQIAENCSKWQKSRPYIWPTGPNVLLTKRHKFVRFNDSPMKVKVTKVRLHRL